jgi:hypothetical protein
MTGDQVLSWAVAILGTGGVAKYVVDMVKSRSGGKKDKAEGAVVLVDSASNYAASVVARLDKVTDEFDAYRRTQDERNRRQDILFRAHARWDDQVRRKLAEMNHDVPDPPPLYSEH